MDGAFSQWSFAAVPPSSQDTTSGDENTVEMEFQRLRLLLGPASLLDLPLELIHMILEVLEDDNRALCSLARTCTLLRTLVEPKIYRKDVLQRLYGTPGQEPSVPVAWLHGAYNNMVSVMKKSLDAAWDMRLAINIDLPGELPGADTGIWRLSVACGSAMHLAAISGSDETIEFLVDLGAKLTLPAPRLCDCLNDALSTHVNVDSQYWDNADFEGWLPLHLALCKGHSHTAELLMNKGAPGRMSRSQPDINAVHSAAQSDHDDWVYQLIQDRVDENHGEWASIDENVNSTPVVDWMGPYGAPLHHAVACGDRTNPDKGTPAIKTLLGLGANINITTPRVPTPLTLALQLGLWDTAWTLLVYGADVTPPRQAAAIFPAIWSEDHLYEKERQGSLEPEPSEQAVAMLRSRGEVIQLIVTKGKLNLDNCFSPNDGETSLTYAGKSARFSDYHVETIPLLIRLGAGVNKRDAKGNTLLHVLASSVVGNEDLFKPLVTSVKYALSSGGFLSLGLKNNKGETPVDILAQKASAGNRDKALVCQCLMVSTLFIGLEPDDDAPSSSKAWKVISHGFRAISGVYMLPGGDEDGSDGDA